jgi:hypothetical protein
VELRLLVGGMVQGGRRLLGTNETFGGPIYYLVGIRTRSRGSICHFRFGTLVEAAPCVPSNFSNDINLQLYELMLSFC